MNKYTVAELTAEIKEIVERSFPRLWVEGEISNYKKYSSGHVYFTLKDASSQISCAMWKFRVAQMRYTPQNGEKVQVEADLQVYERNGNYQLIVQHIQPSGIGALQAAFERLKNKLLEEGLFEVEHKETLPIFPQKNSSCYIANRCSYPRYY